MIRVRICLFQIFHLLNPTYLPNQIIFANQSKLHDSTHESHINQILPLQVRILKAEAHQQLKFDWFSDIDSIMTSMNQPGRRHQHEKELIE